MSHEDSGVRGDVVEGLDRRLRDAIREDGVDPAQEPAIVRQLAERLVQAHDERSLTGAVPSTGDPAAAVDELVARVSGFGALQRYLDDPTVEEIWVNEPSRVFVARRGRHELTSTILTSAEVDELVERMLKSSGRRVDLSQPFVDAMLPGGQRLHVVLEGISRGFSAVNIRKFVVRASELHDLVELGTLTQEAATFLDASVRAGLNVVVAGGTRPDTATISFTRRCPAGSRPRCTTRSTAEATVGTTKREEMFSPARSGSVQSLVSASRALFACRLAIPGSPEFRASRRSRDSSARTSPTITREGRMRRHCFTRSRSVISPEPSSPCCRVCIATQSGCVKRSSKTSSAEITRSSPGMLAAKQFSAVVLPVCVEADTIETEPIFHRQGSALVRASGVPPRPERFEQIGVDVQALLSGAA
jgi:pilus assembly protein CpaF